MTIEDIKKFSKVLNKEIDISCLLINLVSSYHRIEDSNKMYSGQKTYFVGLPLPPSPTPPEFWLFTFVDEFGMPLPPSPYPPEFWLFTFVDEFGTTNSRRPTRCSTI